jgi:hypothetical protein
MTSTSTSPLARVMRGEYDPAPMRRFVERFVRPVGLTQPVSPLVASAVLELANRGLRERERPALA